MNNLKTIYRYDFHNDNQSILLYLFLNKYMCNILIDIV
jgi:hypothetical protein